MTASIKDREAWVMEREEEIAVRLYKLPFLDLPEELQGVAHRWAEYAYHDTFLAYSESIREER